MTSDAVKVGIVGLGRWSRVLTNATLKSDKIDIVAGYSRSQEKRDAYEQEFGIKTVPDFDGILSDDSIKGVILTVPNEQHLPVAEEAAAAGKHVYTEKPIANTLENGLRMEALQAKYGVRLMVGHSARLLKGTRQIKRAMDEGELGKVVFIEANFSNERALEITENDWRWYRDKAPGGPLSQLAIHQFDSLHFLGGEIDSVSAIASKLSPVGAEIDDQTMTTIKFKDGKLGYVGSSWTTAGVYSIRVFGQSGMMHYELDFNTWDTPEKLHETSLLYIQRGKDGYSKREVLEIEPGNMFVDELEMFARMCAEETQVELAAQSGNVALAVVNAALQSMENDATLVRIDDVLNEARTKADVNERDVA